jgi:hypothetical protein
MCADGALKGVPDLEFEYLVLFSFEGKRRFDLYCNVFSSCFRCYLTHWTIIVVLCVYGCKGKLAPCSRNAA